MKTTFREGIIKELQIVFVPICSLWILYINGLIQMKTKQNLLSISYYNFFRNIFVYIIYGISIAYWLWLIKGESKLKKRIYGIVGILTYVTTWILTYIPSFNQSLILFILNNYINISIWIGIFTFAIIISFFDF